MTWSTDILQTSDQHIPRSVSQKLCLQSLFRLRQGPALEGRNSPVFAKRFWKGNKYLNQTQFWRWFLIYLKFEKKFVWHAATHYKPSYRESRRAPLKYLICVQDSVRNFYLKQKILQIVIFRIVFLYLNPQNREKNEKFEIFASVNKKSDFWGKKNCFNYLPNTFKHFFA